MTQDLVRSRVTHHALPCRALPCPILPCLALLCPSLALPCPDLRPAHTQTVVHLHYLLTSVSPPFTSRPPPRLPLIAYTPKPAPCSPCYLLFICHAHAGTESIPSSSLPSCNITPPSCFTLYTLLASIHSSTPTPARDTHTRTPHLSL